jgi:hypothetical protein
MARRPDRDRAEVLNETDLKKLRHSLAHLSVKRRPRLLRARPPRLPHGLHPPSEPPADANACAGMETVVEVAMISEKKSATSFAAALRRELADRAQKYAQAEGLPHCLSYGETPIVCFAPYENNSRHGNFLDGSYKAIRRNPAWARRLAKVHTRGHRSLPATERGRWMELDTCTSSDALLMNVFCYRRVLRDGKISALLGTDPDLPCFGYKARVPLVSGKFDRTEVDLRLGNVLVEAKLTEGDFQRVRKRITPGISRFRGGVRLAAASPSERPLPLLPTSQERARGLCPGLFILRPG